jgi:protein-disulfide isomerase
MKPLHMVALVLLVVLALFGAGAYVYSSHAKNKVLEETNERLFGSGSYVLGNKDAKITVVEFFDPLCAACVRISPVIAKLPEKYLNQVKVVYRALAYHKGSDLILSLLEAAKEQGKFEEAMTIFNARYTSWHVQGQINTFVAWGVLEQAGVDTAKAKEFIDNNQEAINKLLKQNMDDSQALNVTETPTFFVNKKRVKSSELANEIETQIKELYK